MNYKNILLSAALVVSLQAFGAVGEGEETQKTPKAVQAAPKPADVGSFPTLETVEFRKSLKGKYGIAAVSAEVNRFENRQEYLHNNRNNHGTSFIIGSYVEFEGPGIISMAGWRQLLDFK